MNELMIAKLVNTIGFAWMQTVKPTKLMGNILHYIHCL